LNPAITNILVLYMSRAGVLVRACHIALLLSLCLLQMATETEPVQETTSRIELYRQRLQAEKKASKQLNNQRFRAKAKEATELRFPCGPVGSADDDSQRARKALANKRWVEKNKLQKASAAALEALEVAARQASHSSCPFSAFAACLSQHKSVSCRFSRIACLLACKPLTIILI
jgi:hypothetical protein